MNNLVMIMLKVLGALVICATVAGLAYRFLAARMPVRAHAPMMEDFII